MRGNFGSTIAAEPESSSSSYVPRSFQLGQYQLNRLGFGARRITGPETWGPPADRSEAMRTLRRLPELGVNFVDTANSYGPDISEELIREALHPYHGLFIATKGGLVRISAEDRWLDGRPEHLISEAKRSCEKLGVSSLDLWQLHRIDGEVPMDEQFDAIRTLLDEGIIRHAGLCEVSVREIETAAKVFRVATVQNRYNLQDKRSEMVLAHCTAHGIGFIPWYPLRGGELASQASPLADFAAERQATSAQIALAYLLHLSPIMLPIPGASTVAHLEENAGATRLSFNKDDLEEIANLYKPQLAG